MCECEVHDYKRCKRPRTCRHYKSNTKICTGAKLGLYANTYHPVRITNNIPTRSGHPIHQVIDETCPECYPEEAAAEKEQRERQQAMREEEEMAERRKTMNQATLLTQIQDLIEMVTVIKKR